MNLMPDNFFYFLILFTLALAGGIQLLFTYKRSWLNYLNVAMFLLCAFRICTEYYLHQLDNYEHAVLLMKYHGPITTFIGPLLYFTLFYHIKPLENTFITGKTRDFLAFLVFVLPTIIIAYHLFERNTFDTNPVTVDGYWTYKNVNHWSLPFYNIYSYRIMPFVLGGMFLYGIITKKANRIKQSLLAIAFVVIPLILSATVVGQSNTVWKIPNVGIILLVQVFLVSWFVSGYRLFNDGFKQASGDLLNSISDLSIQTDLHLNVINTNSRLKDHFDDVEGSMYLFILENSRMRGSEVKELLNELVDRKTTHHDLLLIDKNEQERLLHIKVSDLFWRGKKNGYTLLLSDLTEIKSKETELANLNQTKDQIFSMIAHDLRKPALAFKGVTNKVNYLIQKKDFDLLNTLGDSIEKSALQLNSLLDNLLKWALSQKNEIRVSEQPVSIKLLTDELINTFELITSEKGIQLENTQVDPSIKLQTDPDILNTILRNLVDNAIKYSHSDSKVVMSTDMRKGHLIINVKDHGIGMSNEQIEKLFALGKEKSTAGTHGERGSGLGMNLVYELVSKTGGVIECRSAPNLGTEMSVSYSLVE